MDKYLELKESLTIEELKEMLNDCNSYDGYFDDLMYQYNDDEFFDIYFKDKMEVARAVCYGSYNYTDDYVKFNAYGNLESCDEWKVEEEIKEAQDEIIEHYLELYGDNCVSPSDSLRMKLDDFYEEEEC